MRQIYKESRFVFAWGKAGCWQMRWHWQRWGFFWGAESFGKLNGWWLHNLASIVEVSRYRGKWPHSSPLCFSRCLEYHYKQNLVFLPRIVLCIGKLHTHTYICTSPMQTQTCVWYILTNGGFAFFNQFFKNTQLCVWDILPCHWVYFHIHFRIAWHYAVWLKHNLLKILMDVHLSYLCLCLINTRTAFMSTAWRACANISKLWIPESNHCQIALAELVS